MKEKIHKEINGEEFTIFVKEKKGERRIELWDKEALEEKHHSYKIIRDKKVEEKGGLFREKKVLPPREEHVANVLNEGLAKYFEKQNKEEEFREQILRTVDVVSEVYDIDNK